VATAVQLRFDLGASPSLDPQTKKRMAQFAGRRLSTAGILVIHAGRFRTQAGNRADALARFTSLLEKSLARPTKRLQTKASAASKERRLRSKKIRAEIKRTRRNPGYV
jgi:ribosome-associated protein